MINLNDDEKLKYSYLQAFLEVYDSLKNKTREELLAGLDTFFEEFSDFSISNYIQLLLLGKVYIPYPSDFKWSDSEQEYLISHWENISNLINTSIENLDDSENENVEQDTITNNLLN